MSAIQFDILPEANISSETVKIPDSDSVTNDQSASDVALAHSTPAQQDVAAVTAGSGQPRPSTVSTGLARVPSQSLSQRLEEAPARQASTPQHNVPSAVNAQYGPPPEQVQLAIAQNARPLAPAPVRVNTYGQNIRPAPPQIYHAAPPAPPPPPSFPPQVFYSHQPGTPSLMNQCPRCGLRAGEPFQPVYYQPQPACTPRKKSSAPVRGPSLPTPNVEPPPPDHPNRHLWVPPPGYVVPPAQPGLPQVPNSGVSSYFSAPVHPEAPTDPPRKNPCRVVLAPHTASSRLPSPPPARRPLTLVDNDIPQEPTTVETHAANGRRRKSAKPYRRRMSRDERRDILLMRKLGYKMEQIARYLGTTVSAVAYTVRQGDPEPKHKNAGRKVNIPEEKIDVMVAYVNDYTEREKVCPVDKRTGRKTMKHLSYNMIRQAVFANENGEILKEFTFTDDALKNALNKRGVWLRAPMTPHMIEVARARGKKMWQEKLERDRLAADEAAAAGAVVEERDAGSRGYIDASEIQDKDSGVEDEDEDDDMDDSSGEDDAMSIPSDAEDGRDDDDDEDNRHRSRGRPEIPPSSLAALTTFGNQQMSMGKMHRHNVLPH